MKFNVGAFAGFLAFVGGWGLFNAGPLGPALALAWVFLSIFGLGYIADRMDD